MPTADRKIAIYPKRLLSLTGIKDNFLDFLTDEIDEVIAAIFIGRAGVLDQDEIEIIAGASNPQFTLDISNAWRVVVGTGQIIDLSAITGTDITEDIFFEDDGSSDYYVGIKFAEVEDGIEINPRTGDPEYPSLKQTYGEVDTPDSVADNTTYIRIVINSITEASVDHTGRTVRVWLVDPVSGVESVAYFEGTSAYSSPNNYVDIPYSGADGPLGQDTTSNPPSTTAADYKVFIEGASWKKNTDLRNDSDYAFIGIITSTGGVPTFDISDQLPIFLITLDRAYDGPAGGGSGRLMYVDAEAVEMRSRTGTTDELFATLRIDRKGGSEDGGACVQCIADETGGKEANALMLTPLTHSGGGVGVTIAGDATAADVFTRSGAENFTTANVNPRCDLAWLQDFATIDGLYAIVAVTASTVQVRNLDGSAPTFPAEGGNLTILRVVQSVCSKDWGGTWAPLAGKDGVGIMGTNEALGAPTGDGGDDGLCALRIYADQVDNIHVLQGDVTTPLTTLWVNSDGVVRMINPIMISPSTDTALAGLQGAKGIMLDAVPPNSLTAPDLFIGGTGDCLLSEGDHDNQIVRVIEPCGFDCEPHKFFDDFYYDASTAWTPAGTTSPPKYVQSVAGGAWVSAAQATDPLPGMCHGGAARFFNPGAVASAELRGPESFWLDTARHKLLFRARFALEDAILANRLWRCGINDPLGNYHIRFEFDAPAHGNQNYWLVVDDGVNPQEKVDTGFGPQFATGNPLHSNFYFAITGHQTIRYWTSDMAAPATFTLSTITFNGAGVVLRPEARHESYAATISSSWLDLWEVRDNEAISGDLGRQAY